MPTAHCDRRFGDDVVRSGGAEYFGAASYGVVQHPATVVTQRIRDFRRWNSVGVGEIAVEGNGVVFLRQVLKDGPMPAKELFALAKEDGHSLASIRRAAKKLMVKKEKVYEGEKTCSQWSLASVSS